MVGLFWVFVNPILMGSTSDQERNRAFSYQMAIFPFGGFVGSWFAGIGSDLFSKGLALSLDAPEPYVYTLLVSCSVCIVAIIAAFKISFVDSSNTVKEEPIEEPSQGDNSFPLKILLLVATVVGLRVAAEFGARNFVNLFLDTQFSVTPSRIAYIYAFAQLLAIPAPLLAPLLLDRFDRGHVFNWSTIGVAVCAALLAITRSWFVVAVAFTLLFALAQIARPAITIISMQSVTPRW